MKVTQLIEELESLMNIHGDVDIIVWEDDISQLREIITIDMIGKENSIVINA